MLWTIILASIASLIYANVGIKIGIDVGKNRFHKFLESDPENKNQNEIPALLIGFIAGAIWPLLIFSLQSKRELVENKMKELPSGTENSDYPVDTAEKLIALQEKRAQLEQGVSELASQIDKLKADPEINKVLRLPKRL